MQSRLERLLGRAALAARQNRAALVFVASWLAIFAIGHARLLHLAPLDALLAASWLVQAPGGLPAAYQAFTDVVDFGVVASLRLTNVTRMYRPEDTSPR